MKLTILVVPVLASLCAVGSCAQTTNAAATTPTVPCTFGNRPASFSATYDFSALPGGFSHTATTDQLIASGGVGVLQSVASEKLDIMYSTATLSTTNRKISADFNFTGAANLNNNMTVYSNYALGSNTYYQGQISKAGALSVIKLVSGSVSLTASKVIGSAPTTGTLELSVCNGTITASVGSDSVSIADASVLSGGGVAFMVNQSTGGTAGGVSIDNFAVFIP